MVLRRPRLPAKALCLAGLALMPAAAHAGDSTSYEFWPEINAYLGLGERSRLMFSAAGTRAMEGAVDDRILSVQDAQFTLNLDYTLAPILRRDMPQAEWSKNRLLWARLGYEYGTSTSSGADSYRSNTGIVELNARYPMEGALWLTSRMRVDFRDINGEASQRYRVRAGAEWDTLVFEHPIAPYASVEIAVRHALRQVEPRHAEGRAWKRRSAATGVSSPTWRCS